MFLFVSRSIDFMQSCDQWMSAQHHRVRILFLINFVLSFELINMRYCQFLAFRYALIIGKNLVFAIEVESTFIFTSQRNFLFFIISKHRGLFQCHLLQLNCTWETSRHLMVCPYVVIDLMWKIGTWVKFIIHLLYAFSISVLGLCVFSVFVSVSCSFNCDDCLVCRHYCYYLEKKFCRRW